MARRVGVGGVHDRADAACGCFCVGYSLAEMFHRRGKIGWGEPIAALVFLILYAPAQGRRCITI